MFHKLSTLALATPILATSVLFAGNAQAFNPAPSDLLSGFANFDFTEENGELTFDFRGGSTDGEGLFLIDDTSTGVFGDYATNQFESSNVIKDFTYSGSMFTIANFLSYNDGVGGKDEWSMDWTNIKLNNVWTNGKLAFYDFTGGATYYAGYGDTKVATGVGGFQGLITVDKGTGTSTLSYKAVPEPFTMLGAGAALGLVGMLKKRKSAS